MLPPAPLQRIEFKGDGSTEPAIHAGDVLIVAQNGKVLAIGRWTPTDGGGELTPPLDEQQFLSASFERLAAEHPAYLNSTKAIQLLCWPDLAEQMQFVE